MKLSNNFWFSEFSDRDPSVLTVVQMYMVEHLARNILQPIRNFLCDAFSGDVKIKIVSGVRFPSDNNRLKKQGFNPSETSDHLFGNITKLRSPLKIRRYGKFYQYSVGAVDIIPSSGAKETWDILRPFFVRETASINLPSGKIEIGQVILERRKSYWIHISNPKNIIYNDFVSESFLKMEPFLQSVDNGVTYKPIL